MQNLFEQSDTLNNPVECFVYDSHKWGLPVKSHWHYFCEIIFVTSGSISCTVDDKTYIVNENETIIFHPKAIHSIEYADSGYPVYIVLKFDINRLRQSTDYAPPLNRIFKNANGNSNAPIVIDAKESNEANVKNVLSDCLNEINGRHFSYGLALDSYIYILLTGIVRIWLSNGFKIPEGDNVDDNDYTVYTITEYIDAHSFENLKVNELAQLCSMSYSYFAKTFQSIYLQSCKDYINFIRINKACDYLTFTDYSIEEISRKTGFADCSHFIRTFKKVKSTTPGKFRNS